MAAEQPDALFHIDDDATLYELLGVTPDVGIVEIKQAYKKQALRWHPDKCSEPNAEDVFKRINTAYSVLSEDSKRAEYNHSLSRGSNPYAGGVDSGQHCGAGGSAGAAAAAYEAWQAFLWAEEQERLSRARRERRCLYGMVSLVLWGLVPLFLLWLFAPPWTVLLFPPPLELTNTEFAKLPLDLEFKGFNARLEARHRARAPAAAAALARLGTLGTALEAGGLLRTHTPYLRLHLNRTAEVRRGPAGVIPKGRGWMLRSESSGEDIYGRTINQLANTFLHMPGDFPSPWPARALCARLLKSGSIRQKDWYPDMSRAVGGRLRPFALAIVPSGECEPEIGLTAMLAATLLSCVATKLTVQWLVPNPFDRR